MCKNVANEKENGPGGAHEDGLDRTAIVLRAQVELLRLVARLAADLWIERHQEPGESKVP